MCGIPFEELSSINSSQSLLSYTIYRAKFTCVDGLSRTRQYTHTFLADKLTVPLKEVADNKKQFGITLISDNRYQILIFPRLILTGLFEVSTGQETEDNKPERNFLQEEEAEPGTQIFLFLGF